jgi:signal transduction histidine kinase
MKNPLTPIRFAVSALSRSAHPEQREPLEVLQAESSRLEQLAHEFTEMGRLPEGPAAEVDLGELVSELTRTALPPGVSTTLELDSAAPRISGHYEPLRRAFSNLLRNAVEAGGGAAGLVVRCSPLGETGAEASRRSFRGGCSLPTSPAARRVERGWVSRWSARRSRRMAAGCGMKRRRAGARPSS